MSAIQRPGLRTRVLRRPTLPALVRREPLLFVGVLVSALVYLTYMVLHHRHFQSKGFDLGIFDQAMWNMSHVHQPSSTLLGVRNILGDHFSPVLLPLIPLYWIWANPFMLFLVEGSAIAASMIPIFLVVRSRVDRLPAYLLVAAYALFWGIQTGVDFAFREVAFIPLFTALIILAIDRKQWRLYAASILALLFVRENEGIFVAFIGLYVLVRGHRRAALLTSVAGIAWFFLATKLIMPALIGAPFRHWVYTQFGSGPVEAVRTIVTDPLRVLNVLTDPPVKAYTMVLSFLPYLFLPVLSPTLILAIPLFGERMLSTAPEFWGQGFHYSLPIAAVLVIGAADGLRHITSFPPLAGRRRLVGVVCGLASLYLAVMIGKTFPLRQLASPSFYSETSADRAARDGLAVIPGSASVAAEDTTLPHVSDRANVFLLAQPHPVTDYVVIDYAHNPNTSAGVMNAITTMKGQYDVVYQRQSFLVFKKRDPPR